MLTIPLERGAVLTVPTENRTVLTVPTEGGLHLLILTGIDEFHQDELLHMLMENVLQRPSPFFPQPCSEFLPREHRS